MAGKGMQIRAGNRGGRDQFDWEDVKVDKYRENYLGHSLKASVGRWQKGKDLTWYSKHSKVAGQKERLKEEVAAIKRAEEEAMAAALGLKPPAPVKPQQALTQQEMTEVCRRRSTEEMENGGEERIKGIGYQSQRAQAMFTGTKSTTTKEGATIFEHDSQAGNDGRLKMSESRRRTISQSDVTSPTTPVPKSETATSTTATATPSNATPIKAVPMPPPLDPVPDSKKAKKRRKKAKSHKEKSRSRHRREPSSDSSISSEPDSRRKKRKRDRESKKRKHRKRERSSSSSSSSGEDEWAEKQTTAKKRSRREVDSHRHKPSSRRHHHHRSSSSVSDSSPRRRQRDRHH